MGNQDARPRAANSTRSECQPGVLGANSAGFTLIELLAAMTILLIIVLIVAQVFQHAGAAWTTGVNRAEAGMKGRALADFMAQELSQAVTNQVYTVFNVSGSTAEFIIIGDANGPSTRAAQKVKYSFSGGTVTREAGLLTAPPVSVASFGAGTSVTMAEGVAGLAFTVPVPLSWESGLLPRYVDVMVTVSNGVFQSRAYIQNRDRSLL